MLHQPRKRERQQKGVISKEIRGNEQRRRRQDRNSGRELPGPSNPRHRRRSQREESLNDKCEPQRHADEQHGCTDARQLCERNVICDRLTMPRQVREKGSVGLRSEGEESNQQEDEAAAEPADRRLPIAAGDHRDRQQQRQLRLDNQYSEDGAGDERAGFEEPGTNGEQAGSEETILADERIHVGRGQRKSPGPREEAPEDLKEEESSGSDPEGEGDRKGQQREGRDDQKEGRRIGKGLNALRKRANCPFDRVMNIVLVGTHGIAGERELARRPVAQEVQRRRVKHAAEHAICAIIEENDAHSGRNHAIPAEDSSVLHQFQAIAG